MPVNAEDLWPLPLFSRDRLYIGIDVGKKQHVAGLLSVSLLKRHQRFELCPSIDFAQSRQGFQELLDAAAAYTGLERCVALVESTGHYHRPLVEFLLEAGITVYLIHVQQRTSRMLKSDKRDALSLANHLFNQVEKEVQVPDKRAIAHKLTQPSATAQLLRALIRHRYELQREATRRKNKLTSIVDELFPEMTEIFKNPNLAAVLRLRAAFPTPAAIGAASSQALYAVWGKRVGKATIAKFAELQATARVSIGTQAPGRIAGLGLEQGQLIKELALLQEHLLVLDTEIAKAVALTREGTILTSLPMIGPILAGTLIAAIGHIDNFTSAAALKSYVGWAPRSAQTGTSLDAVALTRAGSRTTRHGLYLAAINAVKSDTEWRALYERLVPKKCAWDERTKKYKGKLKVIGRICGQMTEMIYMLLKKDAALIAATPAGEEPKPPQLYDRAVHKAHRAGAYRSTIVEMKLQTKATVLRFPDSEKP